MSTPPIMSVTDELIAELEQECETRVTIELGRSTVRRLLSERAELKRDADRYRWLRDTLRHDDKRWQGAGAWNHANIPPAEFDAAIDSAMTP